MRLQHPYSGITTGLLKPITAALSIVALLAGCGSVEAKDSQQEVTSADKVVSVNITEPSNGLLPSDTSDMAGWKIVSQLYDGLVTFDAEGNETLVEAESITPNETLPNTPSHLNRIWRSPMVRRSPPTRTRKAGRSRPMLPMDRSEPPFSKIFRAMMSCRMQVVPKPRNCQALPWSTTLR